LPGASRCSDRHFFGFTYDVIRTVEKSLEPASAESVCVHTLDVVLKVGSSDAEQFSERKIPRITIHSLTQETWNAHILHTSKDKLSAIRLDDYYQTYRLLAYVAVLDQVASDPAPTTH